MDQTALHAAAFLKNIRALLIDIDGTLLRGHLPLPGLVQFFDFYIQIRLSFRLPPTMPPKPCHLSAKNQQLRAQLTWIIS